MRGYYGIGVYKPKHEVNIGSLWRTAKLLGADYLFTIGRRYKTQASDTQKVTRHMPLFHYASFEDMRLTMPLEAQLIAIELSEDAVPLSGYRHPHQAVYLLGAEEAGIPEEILRQCQATIVLPGDHSMNLAVAGSIVMYDRFTKGAA